MNMHSPTVVIDTREPAEYQANHVDGARNISAGQFASGEFRDLLADVPKDAPIIVYCRTGQRSNTSRQFLTQAGYSNVTNGINQARVEQLLEEA